MYSINNLVGAVRTFEQNQNTKEENIVMHSINNYKMADRDSLGSQL